MQPIKKSNNNHLRKRDQAKNRQINKKQVKIEHVFGLMKNYARMTGKYNDSINEFRAEFNTVTGIVNLNIMWKKLRHKYKLDESRQTYFE